MNVNHILLQKINDIFFCENCACVNRSFLTTYFSIFLLFLPIRKKKFIIENKGPPLKVGEEYFFLGSSFSTGKRKKYIIENKGPPSEKKKKNLQLSDTVLSKTFVIYYIYCIFQNIMKMVKPMTSFRELRQTCWKTKSAPNPTCSSLFKFVQVGFQVGLEFDKK